MFVFNLYFCARRKVSVLLRQAPVVLSACPRVGDTGGSLTHYDSSVGALQIVTYGWTLFLTLAFLADKASGYGELQPQAAFVAAPDGQANLPALPERIM